MTCLWTAARVRRYHTVPQVGEQTVADHSFGVAVILAQMCPQEILSKGLLTAALLHDLCEDVTGDIPATAKWNYPGLKNVVDRVETDIALRRGITVGLTTTELEWLKAADLLELCLWCQHQLSLGNSYAREILDRGLVALADNPRTPEPVRRLVEDMKCGRRVKI